MNVPTDAAGSATKSNELWFLKTCDTMKITRPKGRGMVMVSLILTITIAPNAAKNWAIPKKSTGSTGPKKIIGKLTHTNTLARNVAKFFSQRKDYD